jgi:hypothetical protein
VAAPTFQRRSSRSTSSISELENSALELNLSKVEGSAPGTAESGDTNSHIFITDTDSAARENATTVELNSEEKVSVTKEFSQTSTSNSTSTSIEVNTNFSITVNGI